MVVSFAIMVREYFRKILTYIFTYIYFSKYQSVIALLYRGYILGCDERQKYNIVFQTNLSIAQSLCI